MGATHETKDGDDAPQADLNVPETTTHHESLAGSEVGDTETASHHDEKTRDQLKGGVVVDDDEHDDDEGSSHSLDDEAEEHHDPEPEGPEGLNTGVLVDPEAANAGSPRHVLSRASSSRTRPLTIVPRSKRRGLFASLVVIPEVERPYDYSRKTKWTITAIVALAAAGGPIGSNLMYPALTDIARDLNTTETVVNLTVAFYMLAMSIFPLWWSSFSETLGRRTIYIISFALFVVFSVLSALSTNIGMLIAMRILGGGASASVQAVGAGTIADLWEVFERGKAMNTFYLGPLLGPLLAPIVGGALAQGLGWRSTMWFLAIFGGLNFLSLLFLLPETLARRKPAAASPPASPADNGDLNRTNSLARMSTRQSVAVKTKRGIVILRRFLIDPLDCIRFLRLPPVAIVVAFAAITFSSLFILNIAVQSTFSVAPYNYSTIIVGLLYIPSSLGYFITSIVGGRWVDHIMQREAVKAGRYDAKGKLIFLPEDRLRENAWIAASMFPLALIWFGWCADYGVFWFATVVPNFFFGVGSMLVFGAVTTMLTEFMPKRSSSGVALNNFVRNIFSCIGVVVTQPLIDVMGVGWLCTMVALFALISGNVCLFLLSRNSERWRVKIDAQMGVERAAK
ncbi:major facilitator superfamily domain-containing protein [Coniella lustricola]|uniref:Major facilitator superfamily domain-containing protein n=1 Tax=Coniella lustricola TaxID=2025994 RepID=A0A2T3A9N4_9PEZI|nr:major facilitator superfamily domain-containing protein [Coniella lustricola]